MLAKYRDFLLVLTNKFGAAFVGLGITIYFANEASTEVFGQYSLLISIVFIFSSLCCSGCPNLIVSQSAILRSFNLNRMNDIVLKRCLRSSLTWLPFTMLIPLFYEDVKFFTVILILVCILSRVLIEISGAFLRAKGYQVLGVTFDALLRPLFFLLLLLISSRKIISDYYVYGLMISFLIMSALSFTLFKILVLNKAAGLKLLFLKRNRKKIAWNKMAGDFQYITVFQVLGRHADILIIGFLLSNNDIAIYSVSVKIAAVIMYVMVASGSVLAPKLSFLKGKENSLISKSLIGYNKITSFISFVFLVIFLIFGELFINFVFGSKYESVTDFLLTALFFEYLIVLLGNSSVAMNMLGFSRENYIYFRNTTVIQLLLLGPSILIFDLWGALFCMSIFRLAYRIRLCIFLREKGISANYIFYLYQKYTMRKVC